MSNGWVGLRNHPNTGTPRAPCVHRPRIRYSTPSQSQKLKRNLPIDTAMSNARLEGPSGTSAAGAALWPRGWATGTAMGVPAQEERRRQAFRGSDVEQLAPQWPRLSRRAEMTNRMQKRWQTFSGAMATPQTWNTRGRLGEACTGAALKNHQLCHPPPPSCSSNRPEMDGTNSSCCMAINSG